MAEVTHLGQIIAERKLEFRMAGGKTEKVVVQIGLPVKVEPDSDFCCPYSISSNARTILRGVIGIDSVQALELTLATIRNELEGFEKSRMEPFGFWAHLALECELSLIHITKPSTGRGVSYGPAKPGWFCGRAG